MSLLPILLIGAGAGGGGSSSVIGTILTAASAASTVALTATYSNGSSGVGATLTNAGTQAAFTLDSVSLDVGQRVLIKNQSNQIQNGVYSVTTLGDASHNWVLTRVTDFDAPAEMIAGTLIEIQKGTINAGTVWQLFASVAAVGTNNVNFVSINITTKIDQNGAAVFALDTGTADNYVISLMPAPSSYSRGMTVNFLALNANTTNSTLNVNGLGAKPITKFGSNALVANDILANQQIQVIYDGSNFQMICPASTISGSVLSVSGTANRITSTGGTNPVIDISASYVGQTSLVTLGTVTTGTWSATQIGTTKGGTNLVSYTLGDIIYASAANVLSKLAGNTTTGKQYLSQTGDGVNSAAPGWATIAGADVTGAALTKTDDTNVTLTLGGSPSTALLRASSLTLGWTGLLAGTRGGTGVNNGASLITIGGNVTFSGAFTFTATLTGNTNVTFPTSGTLATTAGSSIPTIAQGDLLYGSAANTLSALAKDTNATRYLSNTGTSNNPLWAQVALTTGVSGSLPLANGGTAGTDAATARTNLGLAIGTDVEAYNVNLTVYRGPKNFLPQGDIDNNPWRIPRIDSFTHQTNISAARYICDGVSWGVVSTAVIQATRNGTAPTFAQTGRNNSSSLRINCTTADSSIAATDYACIRMCTGLQAVKYLAQQTTTLSFWVRSPKTGTHCISMYHAINTVSTSSPQAIIYEYTMNAIDTWEYKTITIAACNALVVDATS